MHRKRRRRRGGIGGVGGERSRRKEVLEPKVDGEVEVEHSPTLGFGCCGGVDAEGRREVDGRCHPLFELSLGEAFYWWWWL